MNRLELNSILYACGCSGPTRGPGGTFDGPCLYCAVTPRYCDNGRYAHAYDIQPRDPVEDRQP